MRLAVPIVANTLQPRGMISLSRGLPTIRIVNVARGSILMLRSRVNWGMSAKFWHSAAQCFFGGIGLVFLAFVCFLLGLNLAAAGFVFLILIALLALIGGFIGSVVLSIVAVGCLNYFFTLPLFSFRVDYPQDVLALTAFLTTSIIVTGLTAKVRKMAEEAQASQKALNQTRVELAYVTRVMTLGELTATIAHEVNQPLAGVVSSGNACLRWLASEPPDIEKARKSVDRIVRDANRASEVIGRVHSLAKKAPPKKDWLNINETVQEIIVLMHIDVERNHISLRSQLSDDVPLVWADRIQLQQVILNLIINAIDAISALSDGPRDLLVSSAQDKSNGVLVAVRDSGTGLPPEKLEDIFDAFYTTKPDGMGMGLAICRSIIEAHGGRLWATPNDPRGAVFQFSVPTRQEEAS